MSSYLLRCCQANTISIETLWRLVNIERFKKIKRDTFHSWDVNPHSHLYFTKVSQLTGQPVEVLESLTYYSAAKNLMIESGATSDEYKATGIHRFVQSETRKVCIDCILDGRGHQLLWNIKGVDHCEFHRKFLVDDCSNCSYKLVYSDSSFLLMKCPVCESDLKEGDMFNEEKALNSNTPYIATWRFLLGLKPGIKITRSNIQNLGLKLMYAAQSEGISELCRLAWYRKLKMMVEEKKGTLLFSVLFNVVKKTQKSLEEIMRINISQDDFENILRYPRKKPKPLGICKAPWCPSFGSNNNMKKVDNPYWFSSRAKYNNCSVCIDCYIEYGFFNKTGDWQDVGGAIEIIQEVQRLKMCQFTNNKIVQKTGVNNYKVYEILTYCDYYIGTCFYPKSPISPNQAISCFIQLLMHKGTLMKKSKRIYGWEMPVYFSIFAMSEVKKFLYFESIQYRQRNISNKNTIKAKAELEIKKFSNLDTLISMEEVAASLDMSLGYLYDVGLNREISANNKRIKEGLHLKELEVLTLQAMEFIRNKRNVQEPWLKKEICEYLGFSYIEVFRKKHKDLAKLIDRKFVEMRQQIKEAELQKLKIRAEQVVAELRDSMEVVLTKKAVCEKMGLTYVHVSKLRPELLSYIGFLINYDSK